MANKGKTQATIDGLLACGFTEQEGKSRKYRYFQDKDSTLIYLVGRSGAFRRAPLGLVSKSVSLTDGTVHNSFIYIGRICDSCELSVDELRRIRSEAARQQGVGTCPECGGSGKTQCDMTKGPCSCGAWH